MTNNGFFEVLLYLVNSLSLSVNSPQERDKAMVALGIVRLNNNPKSIRDGFCFFHCFNDNTASQLNQGQFSTFSSFQSSYEAPLNL